MTGMPIVSNRDERLSPDARVLLGLLQRAGDAAALRIGDLSAPKWDDIRRLALRHGVAPLLHRSLQSAGALAEVPEQVRIGLAQDRRTTALDNLRNYGEFRRTVRALQQREIPVIALKGLHLAELVYGDISLRPMGDLDILVPAAQVERAVKVLRSSEYDLAKKIGSAYDIGLTHRRLGILIEIHWSLSQPPEPCIPPVDEVWRRAVPAKLGDADTCVMSPEFLLLHVCAHLANHHVFAADLRALCDIAEIVSKQPQLDWPVVINHSQRQGWGRGVAAALRLARDQLAAAVPGDVLARIGGDTLDSELLADALEQLNTFSETRQDLRFAPNLVGLTRPASPGEKILTLWRRTFVPRAQLALIYGVPERSARIHFYYLLRLRDLLRRYASSAWALIVCRGRIAADVARHARLAKWIAGA